MKMLLGFIIFNALLFTANAVAGGAFLLMAKLTQSVPGAHDQPWVWVTIGLAGVTIAVLFLKGLMEKSW